MSRTTWELNSLCSAREEAGLSPPTCDNCVHDCSDRRLGHRPCTGWYGGPNTINDGPTEAEVYEREVATVAGILFATCGKQTMDHCREVAKAVLSQVRR